MRLFASLYWDVDFTGFGLMETFDDIVDVGMRWNIEGGLQRLEVTVPAHSRTDAYNRYAGGTTGIGHLGWRMVVYDSLLDRYISGTVYEITPDTDFRTVKYTCAGAWKRAAADVYKLSDFPGTGNTDAIIKDILTDSVTFANSDQSNIDPTSLSVGGWNPLEQRRNDPRPTEAIAQLAAMGDSSGNQYDFYFVDGTFRGSTILSKPYAYFKQRDATNGSTWTFSKEDISQFSLARNIWDLRRDVHIAHGRITGTDNGGAARSNLVDTTANFLNGEVSVGDRVVNITTGLSYTVDTLTSATQLDMNTEAGTEWSNGDKYSIQSKEMVWTNTGTSTETDLWTVQFQEARPEMDATQAQKYGDAVLAQYEKPVQQQAFTLGSDTIRSWADGALAPLWRPLFMDSFYFQITDLYPYPDLASFGNADNRRTTFLASAMDYEYSTNKLRIVPTEDARLDVLLQQIMREQRDLSQIVSAESK